MATTKQMRITQLLADEITLLGYECVDVVLVPQGKNTVLRVLIDKTGGVNIDDCTRVTRHISSLLDVEDPIKGHYLLEVSSPGLDRPLYRPEHYERFIGHNVRVRLHTLHENRRQLVGKLIAADVSTITIAMDNEIVTLPLSDIDKGNLEPLFPQLNKVRRTNK